MPTETGQTVQAVDSDGAGGCFAAGFAGTGFGDADVVVWRVTGALVPVLSGKTWDYLPDPKLDAHSFSDFATDVVVRDGVAWVVGFSNGKHDLPNQETRTRGLIGRSPIQ